MTLFNRTQWFEIITALIIFAVGFALAYYLHTSWLLSIVASFLFVLSFVRALQQSRKSRSKVVKTRTNSHAN